MSYPKPDGPMSVDRSANSSGSGHRSEGGRTIFVSAHDLYEGRYDGEVRRAAILLGSARQPRTAAEQMAHDVVADAFCEVLQRWDAIDDPAAYLSRTVLHGCKRAATKRNREPATSPAGMALAGARTANAGGHDRSDELLDAVQQLPWKQRAIVVMKFYEDLTEREIADRMDIRPGSVGPTLNRAMKKLRVAVSEGDTNAASTVLSPNERKHR